MTQPLKTEATDSIAISARKTLTKAFDKLAEGKRLLLSLQALGYEPPPVQPALRVVSKCIDWLDALKLSNAEGSPDNDATCSAFVRKVFPGKNKED